MHSKLAVHIKAPTVCSLIYIPSKTFYKVAKDIYILVSLEM